MNQYCRYCAFCTNGQTYYCSSKHKVLSKSYIKRANKCADYAYTDMGDVDSGKPYSPRQHKTNRAKKNVNQESLFDEIQTGAK